MKISRVAVRRIILDAIIGRKVLLIRYQHTVDKEIVDHRIAPFDIGTSNPNTYERNKDNVYAYSYTHINEKSNLKDPKVCAFNIDSFLSIEETGDKFDEVELTRLNLIATRYDYRTYRFNELPDRDWY